MRGEKKFLRRKKKKNMNHKVNVTSSYSFIECYGNIYNNEFLDDCLILLTISARFNFDES